jgi:hypothetical protein
VHAGAEVAGSERGMFHLIRVRVDGSVRDHMQNCIVGNNTGVVYGDVTAGVKVLCEKSGITMHSVR